MNILFSTEGLGVVGIVAVVVQAVSFVAMLIILFEYRHLHRKRVSLLREFGAEVQIGQMLLERKLLMLAYLIATLLTIILPFALYA